MKITYVFDNTEVVLTGREAVKTMTSGKTETLYEITQLNPGPIASNKWTRWVLMSQLYKVMSPQEGQSNE